MERNVRSTQLLLVALAACSGGTTGGGASASVGASESEGSGASSSTTTVETAEGSGESTAAGSTSTTPPTTSTTTAGSSSAGDDNTPGFRLDVAEYPDLPPPNCKPGQVGGGGNGDDPTSYLWAANSTQGTISKIDTQTVTEVGRYIVRPDSAGSPSRTSVSLSGNVAVANRNGGVTKVYANPENCQNTNGMIGIQTSTSNVALPWGTEECVAWYTPFNYESQRPVAWVQGDWNPNACSWQDERLWTSGRSGTQIDVLLLDGDTGVVLDQVVVQGLNQDFYAVYGGAVDAEGNFWGSQLGTSGRLVRVDIDTLDYEVYNVPPGPHWYGMTVDDEGFVWLCSSTVGRFDPATETWQTNQVGGYTGCMADVGEDGLLWMSTGSGVIGVNRQTLQVEANWPTGGSYGVSIDFQGYVWTVESGDSAHRVDPVTGTVVSYNGLVGAYTYSDMTGFALAGVGGYGPAN